MKNSVDTNVDQSYQIYCNDESTYTQVKEAVDLYVYRYPLVVSQHYEELCGDFWSAIAHKIPHYIKNFVYDSTPFERYLYVSVKFQFITFLKGFIKQSKEVNMYNNEHALFSVAPWKNVEYKQSTLDIDTFICFVNKYIKMHTAYKRLWWLTLHYSPMLPKERLREIGNNLGITKEKIEHTFEALKNDIKIQNNKLHILQSRCNLYFAQRNILDRQLEEDILTRQEYLRLCERREQYNQRYHKLVEQLQHTMASISHARLSEVLHVPKGTIDCGIALLKKQCLRFKPQAHERGLV